MTPRHSARCDVSHFPDWPDLLERAAAIVRSYDTLVTLRQLFYRLVAAVLLPNTLNSYKALSKHTATARRAGTFPALMDRNRTIHRYQTFTSPADARRWVQTIYRRNRTEGQSVSLYLGVEKAGIVAQFEDWFGDLGLPILPLGGYSSESFEAEVIADVKAHRRPAVLLYGGDFDASGEDIDRNFIVQTDCWDKVRRVALTTAQVAAYALPELPGKVDPETGIPTDSRAKGFIARHGRNVQVELDALPPDVLRDLFTTAIAEFFDRVIYDAAMAREEDERATLWRGKR